MATLNIDLSEYDMMRESKKNLENQVEDFKKIIEGLKDKSRLVVRDRIMYRTIDVEALRTRLVAEWQYSSYSRAYIAGFAQQFVDLISHLDYSLYLKGEPKEESRSEQYIGFEDIRVLIETSLKEEYKEIWENKIKEAKEQKALYLLKEQEIENEIRATYEGVIKDLKRRLDEKENIILNADDLHKKEIAKLRKFYDERIEQRDKRISELSKTHEQKLAEAKKELEEAEAAYYKLIKKRKRFLFWNI